MRNIYTTDFRSREYSMSETNCDDAYDINKGDRVTLETTDGKTFTMRCASRNTHNSSDPDDVQEITIWKFKEEDSGSMYQLRRINGLRASEWETEHPGEHPLASWEPPTGSDELETFGYVTEVEWD